MASIGVRVERPVRLWRVGEGVENTTTPAALILRGIAIAALPWLFDVPAFCTEPNDLGRGRHTMVATA